MSEFAAVEIDELQTLLESRPPAPESELPYLPLVNAAQAFHAQVKYLDFHNGRGVRFITQYSQDMTPIVIQGLFYTFQGLTEDGDYYVVATFPISAEELSDKPGIQDWDAFFAGYKEYMKETVNQLNELTLRSQAGGIELPQGGIGMTGQHVNIVLLSRQSD